MLASFEESIYVLFPVSNKVILMWGGGGCCGMLGCTVGHLLGTVGKLNINFVVEIFNRLDAGDMRG